MIAGGKGRKTIRSVKRKRYHDRHPERGIKTARIKAARGLVSKFASLLK